jgi:2-haloacid dehalogenase
MASEASHDENQPGRRRLPTTDDNMGFARVNSILPIRAVVFDVGNVLFYWSLRALFEKLIKDPRECDWFLANVVTEEWHFQHDAGRPLADMVAERKTEFPDHTHLIDAYAARFNETIHAPVPDMAVIVNELAARNIPIFGITNFGAEFWAMFRPTAAVFDHFTDIIVSGEEKLVKPDAEIYQLALTRFGLNPGEAIFVDDRLENTDASAANGFIGHHFTNAATLRVALGRHGLLAAA